MRDYLNRISNHVPNMEVNSPLLWTIDSNNIRWSVSYGLMKVLLPLSLLSFAKTYRIIELPDRVVDGLTTLPENL
jgi:hypothetical protein